MIYFIQDTENRRIKIGVSAEPAQRLKQLQTSHASELKLIAVMDGTRSEEQALHQLFTRKRGEWFEPTRDLLAFIREKTVSVGAISNTGQRRRSAMSEWRPELREDTYIVSIARLIYGIIKKGTGTLDEMVGMLYPLYEEQHLKYPQWFPEMSLSIYHAEIRRLVDIQNS